VVFQVKKRRNQDPMQVPVMRQGLAGPSATGCLCGLRQNKRGKDKGDMMEQAFINTDKELWRAVRGDYYADSIHVTEHGGIGINCGGHVIVAPVRSWHSAGELVLCVNPTLKKWKWKLAMWLLRGI